MSEASSDICKRCQTSFASDSERFCANCKAPRRKPCILCRAAISFKAEECKLCLAPQDENIFEETPLKDCSCGALVMMSSSACYNCHSVLQVGYVLPQHQKSPIVPPIELPQESCDQLSSNVTSTSVSDSGDQVSPQKATAEESSDQSFVVSTPSSGQEIMSVNISVHKSTQMTSHSPVTDLLSSNVNPSGIPHNSQQQISKKATHEPGESINQSGVPSAIHGSSQNDHDQLKKEESSTTNAQLSSDHVIHMDNWDIQPQEVSLSLSSFPYLKSQEETCHDGDGQSENELVANNYTGANVQPQPSPSSLCTSAPVNMTTSLSASGVATPSTMLPIVSPPIFAPHSDQTCTPKHELPDKESMTPGKKRKVDSLIESGQRAFNLSEEGEARDSVNYGNNEHEITNKSSDAQILGSHKMPLDDQGDLSARGQVQTQRKRKSASYESETDTLTSKKLAHNESEIVVHISEKHGSQADLREILTDQNDTQNKSGQEGNNEIFIGVDSDSESSTCETNEQYQHQRLHDSQSKNIVPYIKPVSDESTLFAGTKSSEKRVKTSNKSNGRNNPCIWKDVPQGLIGNPGEMTSVIFHALLPVSLWEFNETSEVYIRFGSDKLGEWNCDIGPMKIPSNTDSELYELTLEVRIRSFIVMKGVPYKYCVYTPRTRSAKEKNLQYEHIRNNCKDYPDEFTNRFLRPSQQKTYYQYDTVIYPALHTVINEGDKGILQKFTATAASFYHFFVGGSGSETTATEAIELPTMEKTRALCLEVYLKKIFAALQSGQVVQPFNMIQNVLHIYECLHTPVIHSDKVRYSSNTHPWTYSHLKHDLKNSLVSIAQKLNNAENISCGTKILVGTVIVCILHEILKESEIALDSVIAVINLLSFKPNFKKEECQDLFVLILNNKDFKIILTEAIEKFFRKLVHAKAAPSRLCLLFNLLTLYHFVVKVSEPFGLLEQNPGKIKWRLFTSDSIFSKLESLLAKLNQQDLLTLYSNLKPLFNINPLLLPVFVRMFPFSEYESLCKVLPPFYAITRLACLSEQSSNISNILMPNFLNAIHFQLKETSFQEIMPILDAVIYLVKATKSKLDKLVDPYPSLFTGLMALLLEAISKILENRDKLYEAMNIANEAINHWIKGTIGGEMFGKEVSSWLSSKQLTKLKDEFGVWRHIFSVFCPENVTQCWISMIRSIVNKRISKVPADFLVDVLEFTEANSVHPMLVEEVMFHLESSLVQLIDGNSSAESLKKLQKLKHITKLGNILNKRYHQSKRLSFEDILEWEAWPGFIKIYVQQRVLHNEGLSERDQEICHEAISIFSSVCMTVVDGSVALSVLCKLESKIESVGKLCEAMGSHTDIKDLFQTPFSFQEVMPTLKMRLKEYEKFKMLQKQFFSLQRQCHELLIPELSIAAECSDITSKPISLLCQLDGSEIVCCYFDSVRPLFPILPDFTILTNTNPSNTFQRLWMSQVDQYKGKTLNCEEVVSLVWTPVFTRVCQFLDCLKNGSVLLTTVDELLKEYSGDRKKMETEFKMLEKGISECRGQLTDNTWIASCVQKMLEYKSLHQIADTAEIFLNLKNVLCLTGDFKVVEDLAVQFKNTVEDQTLQYISDDLLETGKFLRSISKDSMRLDCLKAFTECCNIIQWIRDVTSDVQDLQHFVTIALATASAGEDDYTRDRLSNLRTVGNGFAKLIYSLPPNTGCMELVQYCTSLWETLKRDTALPKKLRDCNEQIKWYKSVKEMQGSVEKSSFGQMNNITNYGSYTVGFRAKGSQLKPLELIHMYLEERDKPLAQKKYSLDELRDLESKLVLITGRESEERDNVDHFLKVFSLVCHIADILIQLLQHGHSKYMGWTLKFPCTLPNEDDDIVDKLTCILKEMSDDLEEWQNVVAKARNEFYSLNYFTTQQLLLLRRELSHFTDSNYDADLKPDVMALLQSLSNELSQKLVVSHIRGLSNEQEDEEEDDMELDNNNSAVGVSPITTETETAASASKLLSSSGPLPKLSAKDLTDNQKMILENLMESFGYSEKLVLLAFERIAKPDIEEEVEKWCAEHEEDYKYDDNEADEDIMDLSYEKVFDNEFQSSFNPKHKLNEQPLIREKAAVKVREVIPVNEEHPNVKDMLLSGYSLEQALEAVETYPDNIEKAMEYIDSFDDTNDEMKGLFPKVILGRQQSRGSYATDIEIVRDVSVKSFLTLQQLAEILEKLSAKCSTSVKFERKFPEILKKGEPNLIIVPPADVHKTALSLYMENKDLPLPTYEEVLLCNESTTDEEVSLLWRKAMGDPNYFRLFCLVHAELLSYQVCDSVIKSLQEFTQGKTDYKVVIVCSNEDQSKSHMVAKLQNFKRPFSIIYKDADFSRYLSDHFTNWSKCFGGYDILASDVDPSNSCVRVVRSTRAGMGKSLYIQRMKEELKSKKKSTPSLCDVVIPVHGPKVTFDSIIQSLKEPFNTSQDGSQACIFHFDVSPNVLKQVDSLLFSLLILRAASDSQGRIWRCHPTHLYAIEVTILKEEEVYAKSSVTLLNLLPAIECLSPNSVLHILKNVMEATGTRTVDSKEFRSEQFQRVYEYLRRHASNMSVDRFTYIHNPESVAENPVESLQLYLNYCGVKDPSWSELKHFVEFLNVQLNSCEKSVFCNEEIIGDVMSGLKTFVIKFMIRMSKDFATSSLKGEVAVENEEDITDHEQLYVYEIDERKQWEQSYHPYLFFNKDRSSITFVGFNVNSASGNIQDPVKNKVIEYRAMTPQLYTGLKQNEVNLSENYQLWNKVTMIQKIGMVMGLEWTYDPDPSYVLTVDNVIKIMAIHMRFRCNIPVIIMGETGCGKTRLIRYMCNIVAQCCKNGDSDVQNMLIMKVHGGTTECDVIKTVEKAEKVASINRTQHDIDTILFFDEANTSDAIGLIKEVMCDRRINGRPIEEDVKFIAACNPYRRHTSDMIKKLESAGLGFFVEAAKIEHKLGKTPLRELVYRVLDLPPSMRPLVYDFGQLSDNTEKDYTHQIVTDRCQDIAQVMGQTNVIQSVSKILSWSQEYMRKRKDECSFVSLRDVERAMIVFKFFCDKKDLFTRKVTEKAIDERQKTVSDITRALILAVSVCYHARLQVRKEYEDGIIQQFTNPLVVTGRDQFCNEIRWCQDVLLDNMKLGPNIARNAALRENVFMMAICIELRIPLFLVGKPGSSKSLAKSIVADSMLGRVSDKELIREFKEVHMFSYQCSQLSTPVSVIEVFKTAKGFQEKQNVTNYVSVVVLDEVGLAEDSPNLPLKALHPLLEDGTEGADATEQIIMREERVAFIGISNWALDPAKMNRGVMVTRGDPDVDELVLSAKGICSNEKNDPVKEKLKKFFKPLASAYIEICKKQEEKQKPFFGLRDFYSLIKMLYWMCKKSKRPLTGLQLQHAIKRNFGGLDVDEIDTYGIFEEYLGTLEQELDLTDESLQMQDILAPDCSPLGLIKKSLQTKEVSWHGENRYLLFLTENYAALRVIKHYLHKEVGLSHAEKEEEMSSLRFKEYGLEDSFGRNTNEMECIEQRMEPFVLFGSSFPKDREYTQVCRNINQIKICMETGRTVILLNLENLYESLYDLLNQYYIHHGDQRYVDLGLQTHRVKCRVHHNFKLILIAEKGTVYKKFPTPLINRLEKHFVLSETVLLEWQKEVLENLICWINKFSDISGDSKFTKHDAFVGYQSDTPASVTFQATHLIQQESHQLGSHEDLQEAVFECSKKIFLQMASPEALIRLKYTSLADEQQKLSNIYFSEQHHGSIVEFLNHYLHRNAHDSSGLLIQVTTHSHLLSKQELNDLFSCLDIQKAGCFLLQEFDTEMNFSHKISPSFSDENESLLIIQCDSGHLYGDLLACARYRIDDEREKSKLRHTKGNGSTHVLFLIHLPRQIDNASSSFVGFQGGSWISAHIDDIRPPLQSDFTLDDAQSAPISQLFYNGLFITSETISSAEQVLSVEMKEDSEMTGSEHSDEAMVTETLFEKEPQLQTEEENISDTTVLYDDGLRIEDLNELTVHETMYDEHETSEHNKKMNDEVEVSTKKYFQCIRLYNCIQAAVASLMKTNGSETQAASAMRVKILLKQIPQNPSFPLDTKTFYGALVKHIKNLLEEREKSLLDQEWVLKEALSGKNLQSGGTFQNVLSRKLDEVIIPIFAAVLLVVDQYSNLNILEHSSDHIIALWLDIFSDDEIVRFDYQNYAFGKGIAYHDLVPGTGQVLAVETKFDCVFPFFWLIKKAIELKWNSIKSYTGDYRQDVHIQLCDTLSNDPVAIVLNKLPEEHWSELCQLYLTDVLKSTHNIPHRSDSDEYEILKKALCTIIHGPSMSPHNSFISLVSAVHVVYNEYQQEIMWFGRLTALIPGILVKLKQEEYCDSTYFRLPLHAVKLSITPENLALPLSPDKREYICQRLVKLQLCQNPINSILALSPSDNLTPEIRITWQRVRAVQLFIEHVAMKCSMDEQKFIIFVQYANRINVRLKCEFVKKEAISNVEKVLRVVDREAKSKLKYAVNMQKKVRECCKSYFMEIVSSLCFGQHIPPESDLIIELLNVVFTEQNKTKEFTYSEEEKTDEVPVIRSFLLQLLLEHNMEEVKEHLSVYFKKAQDLIKSDYNLCLLCIQCLEDSIYKQHGQISLQMKIEKALTTLEQGKNLICHNTAPHPGEVINLDYLEGVSLLRYSLTVVAELIYYQYSNKESERITYTHQSQLLLDMARKCCSEFDNNEDETGPGVFLVKQIARQYGVAFLTHLTSEANMQWVIPHNLRHSDDVETNPVNDPFVIYENYGKMHSILANAVYGKDLTQLQATVQTLVSTDVVPLVLGVYQVVTGSAVFTAESKIIPDDIKGEVMATIRHCEGFTRNMKWIVQHLIEDTYYGRLDIMTLRPGMSLQNRLFTDLIIHVAIAIQYTSNKLLTPFIQMMTQPGVLKECFLPTMPQDSLPDVRNAIGGGQFYECPRGHPYFVSECGRPVQQYICPICHSRIGGQNHKLESTNRTARTTDITETGYALGQPHQRESTPSTERSLSLPACAIIRALMHCSLLWSSCTNEPAMGGLFELVKTQVKPNEMSLFFWHHLKHDIAMLSTALGKSQDDVCLVLHMILKNIATLNPRGTIVANLHSKELRNQWEKIFSDTIIKPVLMNIDANLHEATVLQMNNKREDCDRLFYVIHEKVQLPPNIIIPHLWSYRSRITLKHLLQVLQTKKESHPILHEFLIQEQFLRATQYLPFIVKLQQQMFNLSHKKLDRKEATELTIRDYLNSFKQSKGFQNENKRNQFKEKLNCTIKAWNLVKERLKDARIQVDPNIVTSLTWDESTSLSYLIPTLTGDGACTVALVGVLVQIHNDFIEKCESRLRKEQKMRNNKVPASQIQICHLLDYEHQIMSIVLSHCHYSLKHGKGQDVTYDFPALEKHIVDRFIYGKPYIQLELPQVVYRKEVHTAEAFANIRKNVQPQKQLTREEQIEIVNELGSMQRLRKCLDVVEIVIGFLSSGKSNSKTELKTYIHKVLRMDEKRFASKKAMEYCTLGHILSLWEVLSVQMAKCLTVQKQEAFDSYSKELMSKLNTDQEAVLLSYLKGIKVPPLINLLFEFIETTVHHYESYDIGIDWPLRDTLYIHLENNELENLLPEGFRTRFPESVTVDQSVETWKTIVIYQHKHEQKTV